MRAPYNVLVLPYYCDKEKPRFCIFKREDMDIWQFIAGGGENEESPFIAAKRESFEEAGISDTLKYNKLQSMCYVSVNNFSLKSRAHWDHVFVIPVYAFSVRLYSLDICISNEHKEYLWCSYDDAIKLLHFDLDKTALFELNERIKNDQWLNS